MRFDRICVVDWSAAGKPTTGKDSIWIALHRDGQVETRNHPTRTEAETALRDIANAALAANERLLIAVDFALGGPRGLAERLTGEPSGLALWDYLANAVTDDARNRSNYRDVAAAMNRALGQPAFWGNGTKGDVPDLPRLKPVLPHGLPEHRKAETDDRAAGLNPKPIWQLAGAGAVGAQSLTGIPALHRLRAALGSDCAVWPLEQVSDHPVVIAETYLSLLVPEVRAEVRNGAVQDEAQVRLHARAFAGLGDGIAELFAPDCDDATLRAEGWYLGAGMSNRLRAALPPDMTPPRLRNDCFAMPQGVSWMPVETALARLRQSLSPVVGTTTLRVADAAGHVLAADVTARRSNPPRANSAVDGYGFGHASTGDGVQRLPLVAGRAAAGQPFDGAVPAGMAVRILTGAILPAGVDCVVLEEDCATDGVSVTFDGPVKPRANVRKAGEDVVEGDLALPAGHRLRAPDLALLSALAIPTVEVYRRLRVGVLSTGDEIIADPSVPARPHQIYDANRPMLLSMVRGWGAEPVDLGHVPDKETRIRATLTRAAAQVDVILTSGGASAGDEDHVSRLLAREGNLQAWRIAIKPGRPLALAMWDGVPVFGLPGNPVAAMVCAVVFARPALSLMGGGGWLDPTFITVPAAFEKRKKPGRCEYLRARLDDDGRARVFASEGSGRISGLSWADGIVALPDEAADITHGTPVRYISYAALGIG